MSDEGAEMEKIEFVGESSYFDLGESDAYPEGNRASLDDAFEDAAGKAREAGYVGAWFDARIQILTRERNQNVKTYRVTITPGG